MTHAGERRRGSGGSEGPWPCRMHRGAPRDAACSPSRGLVVAAGPCAPYWVHDVVSAVCSAAQHAKPRVDAHRASMGAGARPPGRCAAGTELSTSCHFSSVSWKRLTNDVRGRARSLTAPRMCAVDVCARRRRTVGRRGGCATQDAGAEGKDIRRSAIVARHRPGMCVRAGCVCPGVSRTTLRV